MWFCFCNYVNLDIITKDSSDLMRGSSLYGKIWQWPSHVCRLRRNLTQETLFLRNDVVSHMMTYSLICRAFGTSLDLVRHLFQHIFPKTCFCKVEYLTIDVTEKLQRRRRDTRWSWRIYRRMSTCVSDQMDVSRSGRRVNCSVNISNLHSLKKCIKTLGRGRLFRWFRPCNYKRYFKGSRQVTEYNVK